MAKVNFALFPPLLQVLRILIKFFFFFFRVLSFSPSGKLVNPSWLNWPLLSPQPGSNHDGFMWTLTCQPVLHPQPCLNQSPVPMAITNGHPRSPWALITLYNFYSHQHTFPAKFVFLYYLHCFSWSVRGRSLYTHRVSSEFQKSLLTMLNEVIYHKINCFKAHYYIS